MTELAKVLLSASLDIISIERMRVTLKTINVLPVCRDFYVIKLVEKGAILTTCRDLPEQTARGIRTDAQRAQIFFKEHKYAILVN